MVELYTNEGSDDSSHARPFIFLPKYSYFGDYQILYNLKSNIVFKTLNVDKHGSSKHEQVPDIIFMCVSKTTMLNLCDLFP